VPVSFQKYTGTATTYVTFHEYYAAGEDFSEDEEESTEHNIQIDVFSKGNYNSLCEQIKTLLVNFKRTGEWDMYEKETGYYHKVIRLYYKEVRING
jgi:hypothetical protein